MPTRGADGRVRYEQENYTMEQNRFKTKDWDRLKANIEGHLGNISHECGKDYTYLCYLRVRTQKDHFTCDNDKTYGHKKWNVNRYPTKMQEENMRYWKDNLHEDDWDYFFTEGIAWPPR